MLERARARAVSAVVGIELVEADARDVPDGPERLTRRSWLACAFCLVADDAELTHVRAFLSSIYGVLHPGGQPVLTGLNAGRLLAAWHRGESAGQLDLLRLTLTETASTSSRAVGGSTSRCSPPESPMRTHRCCVDSRS
jgi:hypothetical protein